MSLEQAEYTFSQNGSKGIIAHHAKRGIYLVSENSDKLKGFHEVILPNTPVMLFWRAIWDPKLNEGKNGTQILKCALECVAKVGNELGIDVGDFVDVSVGNIIEFRYPNTTLKNSEEVRIFWQHIKKEMDENSELLVMRNDGGGLRRDYVFDFQETNRLNIASVGIHATRGAISAISWLAVPRQKPKEYIPGKQWPTTKHELAKKFLGTLGYDAPEITSVTPMYEFSQNLVKIPRFVRIASAQPEKPCMIVNVYGQDSYYSIDGKKTGLNNDDEFVRDFLLYSWSAYRWVDALNQRHIQVDSGQIAEMIIDEYGVCKCVYHKYTTFLSSMKGFKYIQKSKDVGWKLADVAKMWVSSLDRMKCKRIIFDPQKRPGLDGDFYNMWSGFAVTPQAPASGFLDDAAVLIREHLKEVICNNDEVNYDFVIKRYAHLIQFPWRKLGVACVNQGEKDAGKSMATNVIRDFFGNHGSEVTQSRQITGNFNAHLAYLIYIVSNEAVWGGEKQSESTMKGLITDAPLQIERKGVDIQEGRNYISIDINSNSGWCIPATVDNRRFVMNNVSDKRVGDHEYFDRLYHAIDHGEREEFLWYLQRYPLEPNWKPADNLPPRSHQFVEQILNDRKNALLNFFANEFKDGNGIVIDGMTLVKQGEPTYIPGADVKSALMKHSALKSTAASSLSTKLGELLGPSCFNNRVKAPGGLFKGNYVYKFSSTEELKARLANEILMVPGYFDEPVKRAREEEDPVVPAKRQDTSAEENDLGVQQMDI